MATETKIPFPWEALETEKPWGYVGQVLQAEVRAVDPTRASDFARPPAPGVVIYELYLAIKPLDHTVVRDEGKDYYENWIQLTDAKGEPKRANSVAGLFRKSVKELGFPDPTTTVGRIFRIERGRVKFGPNIEGWVTQFKALLGSYEHEGELPQRDLRKTAADAEGYDNAATAATSPYDPDNVLRTLAAALDGVDVGDFNNVLAVIRSDDRFRQSPVPELVLHGVLLSEMVEEGYINIDSNNISTAQKFLAP